MWGKCRWHGGPRAGKCIRNLIKPKNTCGISFLSNCMFYCVNQKQSDMTSQRPQSITVHHVNFGLPPLNFHQPLYRPTPLFLCHYIQSSAFPPKHSLTHTLTTSTQSFLTYASLSLWADIQGYVTWHGKRESLMESCVRNKESNWTLFRKKFPLAAM